MKGVGSSDVKDALKKLSSGTVISDDIHIESGSVWR